MRSGCLNLCSAWAIVSLPWRPGSLLRLDIEDVLSGTGGDQLHVMVADVIKSFDTVDRSILGLRFGSPWDCLTGFVRFIFLSIVMFVFGLSLLLALVSFGVGMAVFPRAVL